jgi:hypothetical protein
VGSTPTLFRHFSRFAQNLDQAERVNLEQVG